MSNVKITPSVLSANLLDLSSEIRSIEEAGADYHHIDVMDGHFVPNLSFGLPIIASLKRIASIPLDVHLMVSNPDLVVSNYIEAGAERLAFHVEAATHHHRLLSSIKDAGVKAGIAINPGTPLTDLEPLLQHLDFITIMSVNPGFSGQSFIDQSVDRVRSLRAMLVKQNCSSVEVAVDGGINLKTARLVKDAGANVLVSGSFLYSARDKKDCVRLLKEEI